MLKVKITFFVLDSGTALERLDSSGTASEQDKGKDKKVYSGTPVMWRGPSDIEWRNLPVGRRRAKS